MMRSRQVDEPRGVYCDSVVAQHWERVCTILKTGQQSLLISSPNPSLGRPAFARRRSKELEQRVEIAAQPPSVRNGGATRANLTTLLLFLLLFSPPLSRKSKASSRFRSFAPPLHSVPVVRRWSAYRERGREPAASEARCNSLASPLPSGRLVARPVGLVKVGDLGHKRVVGVRVGEHRADTQEDCWLSDGWRRDGKSEAFSQCVLGAPQAQRRREDVPLEMVRAGDHCSRRMSRQMDPLALILKARETRRRRSAISSQAPVRERIATNHLGW